MQYYLKRLFTIQHDGRMKSYKEYNRNAKEVVIAYSAICLSGLRITVETYQDKQCPGTDYKQGPPEHKKAMLLLQ
jgi:hypothetical protein